MQPHKRVYSLIHKFLKNIPLLFVNDKKRLNFFFPSFNKLFFNLKCICVGGTKSKEALNHKHKRKIK